MKRLLIGVALCALLAPATANAQATGEDAARGTDRSEITRGATQIERDSAEGLTFDATVDAYAVAVKKKDMRAAATLHSEIVGLMQREIAQSKRKIVKARDEVKRTKALVRAAKRDAPSDTGVSRKGMVFADERDDERDLRDDRRDLAEQETRLKNQRRLLTSTKRVTHTGKKAGWAGAKKALEAMRGFEETLKRDLEEGREELREDRRQR